MPSALIVDDEPATGSALTAILEIFGYRAGVARTGNEAQRHVREAVPDVVLLDLMLPDLHGLEICRAWKADAATALLPVVIVSARLASHNRAECFRSGACGFVSKPFTIDQIQRAVEDAAQWSASMRRMPLTGTLACTNDEDAGCQFELNRIRCALVARGGLADGAVADIVDGVTKLVRGGGAPEGPSFARFVLDDRALALALPLGVNVDDPPPWPFRLREGGETSPAEGVVLEALVSEMAEGR